jgi:hypothetical protein
VYSEYKQTVEQSGQKPDNDTTIFHQDDMKKRNKKETGSRQSEYQLIMQAV